MGFYDQVGFYCKKDELKKFHWDKIYDDWYWWMDRHLKSVTKIHEMPSPPFFFYDNPEDESGLIEPDFAGWAALKARGGTMLSGSVSGGGGYTDYQKAVSDAAESGAGCSTENGMCAQFVTDVFTQASRVKSDIKVPWGNANNYWENWKSSGGTDKNPPVGSVVFGGGWPYQGGYNPYGHVGVVLTDGRIADNVGYHRISDSVDAWSSGQNNAWNGQTGYRGWVWANNQDLSKMGTMIGGGISLSGMSGSKVLTINGVTIKLPVDVGYALKHQSNYNGANWTGQDSARGIGIFNCSEEGDDSYDYKHSYALSVRWEYVCYTLQSGKWPAHEAYSGVDSTGKINVGGISHGIGSINYIDGVDIDAYVRALSKARILCYNPKTGKGCVCGCGFYAYNSPGNNSSMINWGGNPLALLGGITTAVSDAIGAEQNKSVLELYLVDPNTKLGPV